MMKGPTNSQIFASSCLFEFSTVARLSTTEQVKLLVLLQTTILLRFDTHPLHSFLIHNVGKKINEFLE